jgi:glutamine phosphoribosylpyrophosphate amidotransferase
MIQFFTLSLLVPEYINFNHLQSKLDGIHIQETRMRAGVLTASLIKYVAREGTDQQ